MNQTEKRRAIALIKDREKEAVLAAADVPSLEVPKAIQAKADKARALIDEIESAGFHVSHYAKKWTAYYDNDHPDQQVRRERIDEVKAAIKKRAERIELDIWSGRIEDFAEAEAQANALAGGK